MPERLLDLTSGTAMIVTDLHGEWEPYRRYRDEFITLHTSGEADRLILCGDLIHSSGPAAKDGSLDMILDVIQLQKTYGHSTVIMLLGNHELPHIYGFSLSRGDWAYTPRFEAALTAAGIETREQVETFFMQLPFFIRTAAGVMITHAGASMTAALPENVEKLAHFSHADFIAAVDNQLPVKEREQFRQAYAAAVGQDYDEMARYWLAVTGPEDPRYDILLRGAVLNQSSPEFNLLWEVFFNRNENEFGLELYRELLPRFLAAWSENAPAPQRVLVSGHIPVRGGHKIIGDSQLRLASWEHAHPHNAGVYLLLDCTRPVDSPQDLLPELRSVFA